MRKYIFVILILALTFIFIANYTIASPSCITCTIASLTCPAKADKSFTPTVGWKDTDTSYPYAYVSIYEAGIKEKCFYSKGDDLCDTDTYTTSAITESTRGDHTYDARCYGWNAADAWDKCGLIEGATKTCTVTIYDSSLDLYSGTCYDNSECYTGDCFSGQCDCDVNSDCPSGYICNNDGGVNPDPCVPGCTYNNVNYLVGDTRTVSCGSGDCAGSATVTCQTGGTWSSPGTCSTSGNSCTYGCPSDYCGGPSNLVYYNYPPSVTGSCNTGGTCTGSCSASPTDCSAVATTDNDWSGSTYDNRYTGGTVVDTTGCSASGCTTTSHPDSCRAPPSQNDLDEYWPNVASYGTTLYGCNNLDGNVCGTGANANKVYAEDWGCSGAPGACTLSSSTFVEDCTTKKSVDSDGGAFESDGGDERFYAGHVTDYSSCSSGSCPGSISRDSCSGSTLTEYCGSTDGTNCVISPTTGALVVSKTYACDSCTGSPDARCVDNTNPVTTATGTKKPSNNPYSFNTWSTEDVQITLSCTDTGGSIGCGATQYCVDSTNTCAPVFPYSSPFLMSNHVGDGTWYVRYQSSDRTRPVPNLETVKWNIVKIDRTNPTGTLSVTPTTARIGDSISVSVAGSDNIKMGRLDAYYSSAWHYCYCDGSSAPACTTISGDQKSCSNTWATSETSAGSYTYYGHVNDAVGRGADTAPASKGVTIQACSSIAPSRTVNLNNGCSVVVKPNAKDDTDGSSGGWLNTVTGATYITTDWDDAPSGSCDFDFRFTNYGLGPESYPGKPSWFGASVLKEDDDCIPLLGCGNSVSYGYIATTSGTCKFLSLETVCGGVCPLGVTSQQVSVLVPQTFNSIGHEFRVGECLNNGQCSSPTPFCDTNDNRCKSVEPVLQSPSNGAAEDRTPTLDVTSVTDANSYQFYVRSAGQTPATALYKRCSPTDLDQLLVSDGLQLNTQYWWSAKACTDNSCATCGSYATEKTFTVGQCDSNTRCVDKNNDLTCESYVSNQCLSGNQYLECNTPIVNKPGTLYTCLTGGCTSNDECNVGFCCTASEDNPGGLPVPSRASPGTCQSRGDRRQPYLCTG